MSLKRYLAPYYGVNLFTVWGWYLFVRFTQLPKNAVLFENDAMGLPREGQIITLALVVIATKLLTSPTWESWIGTAIMVSRVAVGILFFMDSAGRTIYYVLVHILSAIMWPQPAYGGPSKVEFYNPNTFQDYVVHGASAKAPVYQVVEFYAGWDGACRNFSRVFADLSLKYGSDHCAFAKIDLARFESMAEEFDISFNAWSSGIQRQLPTVILFEAGKEIARIPSAPGSVLKAAMSRNPAMTVANVSKALNLAKATTGLRSDGTTTGWKPSELDDGDHTSSKKGNGAGKKGNSKKNK